jgi:hypothetical protein
MCKGCLLVSLLGVAASSFSAVTYHCPLASFGLYIKTTLTHRFFSCGGDDGVDDGSLLSFLISFFFFFFALFNTHPYMQALLKRGER